MFKNTSKTILYTSSRINTNAIDKGWGKSGIFALKWLYSTIYIKIRKMAIGYFILGHLGLPCQISNQTENPIYIKHFLQSRLGLKTLIPHDLKYAEFYWSMDSVIYKGESCNIVW